MMETLMGFVLREGFSHSIGDLPRSILSRASFSGAHARPEDAPQSVEPTKR
jgi:hypothetical protein